MSLRFVFDEVKVPQSMRKQTSNRKIALQKCLENAKRRKIALRLLKEGKATGKISAIRSVHMRQTDRRTAEKRLNIVWEVKDPSRILQRVSIVVSEQKTINSILMNFHPVQSVTAPVRTRTSLPSGAPAEHLTLGQMLPERRKLKMKNYGRKRNSRNALPKKGQRRARKSIQKVNNK